MSHVWPVPAACMCLAGLQQELCRLGNPVMHGALYQAVLASRDDRLFHASQGWSMHVMHAMHVQGGVWEGAKGISVGWLSHRPGMGDHFGLIAVATGHECHCCSSSVCQGSS